MDFYERFKTLFSLKILALKKHKVLTTNHIYHLETPRFNEGVIMYPPLTSIIFTKYHIYIFDAAFL